MSQTNNSGYNQPLAASINSTPAVSPLFPINIGQVVRILFQQPYDGASKGSQFSTMSAAQTLSNWTTLIAAVDGTSVFYTPLMSNTKIGKAKPLETSADSNMTYIGQPEFFGMGGSSFTGEFRAKDAPSLAAMAKLPAFSQQDAGGQSNLSGYLLNANGDVIGKGTQSGATITNIQPINLFNYWYGPMSSEGYATGTAVECGMWLPPGWSDDLIVIPRTAAFDLRLLK